MDAGSDAPKAGSVSPTVAVPMFGVATASLPTGQAGVTYATTALEAVNAGGPVAWDLAAGTLPQGLALSPAGVLSGTPLGRSFQAITVRATTGTQSATRTLGLSVGVFGLVADTGLIEGRAWTEVPVGLTCSGATGNVRFEIVSSGSAGGYAASDPLGGTALWMPGELGGPGRTDTLRAVDTHSGATAVVAFPVVQDPTAGFAAEFGRSDVWYVDATAKVGTHDYATDFQDVLVTAGLRQVSSTSRDGADCDRLAEMAVRLAMLRYLNTYYLRNADGSQGSGLPISFPYGMPQGHERPLPGSTLSGRSDRFSVISITHGGRAYVVGMSFEDGSANPVHENNTTTPSAGDLGVFANQFVDLFNLTYNNWELTEHPITADDTATLEAVVYGLDVPAGRPEAIRMAIDGLGRSLASVAAHEVGHSLGLQHTAPAQSGSIMNGNGAIAPSVQYHFTDGDVSTLRARLPGPGRWGPANVKPGTAADDSSPGLPEGGIQVCEGKVCELRLLPCPCGAHGGARRTAPVAGR